MADIVEKEAVLEESVFSRISKKGFDFLMEQATLQDRSISWLVREALIEKYGPIIKE